MLGARVFGGLFLPLEGGIVDAHLGVLWQLLEPQWGVGVDVVLPPAVLLSSLPQLLLVVLDPLHVGAAVWRFDKACFLSWTVHCPLPMALGLTRGLLHITVHMGRDHPCCIGAQLKPAQSLPRSARVLRGTGAQIHSSGGCYVIGQPEMQKVKILFNMPTRSPFLLFFRGRESWIWLYFHEYALYLLLVHKRVFKKISFKAPDSLANADIISPQHEVQTQLITFAYKQLHSWFI